MPGLISSAAPGKKAAPKAPARRRAPAVPSADPASVKESLRTTAAPASPTNANNYVQPLAVPSAPDDTAQEPASSDREATRAYQHPQSPTLKPSQDPELVSQTAQGNSDRADSRPPEHDDSTTTQNESNSTTQSSPATISVQISQSDKTDTSSRDPHPPSAVNSDDLPIPSRSAVSDVSRKRFLLDTTVQRSEPQEKRLKRSSGRSHARSQVSVERSEGLELPVVTGTGVTESEVTDSRDSRSQSMTGPATRRPRISQKRGAARTDSQKQRGQGDGQSADTVTEPQESPQPRVTKRKKKQKRTKGGEQGAAVEETSDAEQHEIDPKTVSMFTLSFDTRHGKISEREKAMAAIDWDEVARARREAAGNVDHGAQHASGVDITNSVEARTDTAEPAQAPENNFSVQFEVDANGDIVPVEESLRVDRTAGARRAAHSGEPVLDQNDLTSRINRTTWANENRRDPAERVAPWKWKSDPWSEEETDRFYDALRMFGTDFFIISKMFAPKTRRMIKAKFVREERIDPERINNALMGKETKPMNLEHYAQETGRELTVFTKYDDFAHAESVIRESMREKQEAMTEAMRVEAERASNKAEQDKLKAQEKKRKGQAGRKTRDAAAAFDEGNVDD